MSEVSPREPSGPADTGGDGGAMMSSGVSPYATGGGGVTFERRVAVQYLAHLLVGDGAVELGDGRRVLSVAFQQAPTHAVDDLVVHAARADEHEPSLVLALAVRRAPRIASSDEDTRKLIRQFVRAVVDAPEDGPEHRLGLVVAGSQTHAEQLAKLAAHAAVQMDAPGFFELIQTPNKFDADVRRRLDQLQRLVEIALHDLGDAEVDPARVQRRTWQLLSRLSVLMPRLESPDETDWSVVENSLISVARDADLAGASRLRDRLVDIAAEYSPLAARVDLKLLRRAAHVLLDPTVRRREHGWQRLDHLHERALASVRDAITSGDGLRSKRLERSEAAAGILAALEDAAAVVVTGESGVGKSSLALHTFAAASAADPDTFQALCINLRHVPVLTIEFENTLGSPLSRLVDELSAPRRVLVVDGADAVAEGREDAFAYLVEAARQSDVSVVAVCAVDARQIVYDTLAERFQAGVAEHAVRSLTDVEIGEVVATFPELGNLKANPKSRELLGRLVVVDLLVRGRVAGVPLTDADAMNEVWSGLVRRREASDRGFPEARQSALLRLAALELSGGDRLNALSEINQAALDGLRRDGLLRTAPDDPFKIGPEFAHDEVRRYAVARLLLADGNPASGILRDEAPRWSLPAARLACQAWLAQPDSAGTPLQGRFAALQASFDALVEAGHGARWADVPGESLLTLADPGVLLRDAWPRLRSDDDAGLRQLARLVGQRHRDGSGIVDLATVEPIITQLLEDHAPWKSGDYAERLLREWLRAHIVEGAPAGHPLRILFRERLVEACDQADRDLAEQQATEVVVRAALSPEKVEEARIAEERSREIHLALGCGNRRERPKVPGTITKEVVLELLALLGPDLGTDGERILRRVVRDAPSRLGPSVEEFLTDDAVASYGRGLLAVLTAAYYIDDSMIRYGFLDDGIRRHRSRSFGLLPQYGRHRGPFLALLRSDFRNGVAVLNRLLNHAALIHTRALARPSQTGMSNAVDTLASHQIELKITGSSQSYVGDENVWSWYRGGVVGPYPCFSALIALEYVCDELIKENTPVGDLVSILLDGCESLSMVGLIVGVLIRHLEEADQLLDLYLVEPRVWDLEFRRLAVESSKEGSESEALVASERRRWSLREAAVMMVLNANDQRAVELRILGETLVENARRQIESGHSIEDRVEEYDADESNEKELARVRSWASSLDRDRYHVHENEDSLYVQVAPPEDVVDALQSSTQDLQRVEEDARLSLRYHLKLAKGRAGIIDSDELAADITSASELLEEPPSLTAHRRWDTPAMVAAAALQAHLLRGVQLSDDAVAFAADTILRVGEGNGPPLSDEFEMTYFEQGADRSAARSVPLLLMPVAAPLRTKMDGRLRHPTRRERWLRRVSRRSTAVDDMGGITTLRRARAAGIHLAQTKVYEVRLHLARGLDHLWESRCAEAGGCQHEVGLLLATETMRDCVLGAWDRETARRSTVMLKEPVAESLAGTAGESIIFARLDAAIRALAPASRANICVSPCARALLLCLLAAQRRSLLSNEREQVDPDDRGTHSIVAARALLTLAEDGDDEVVDEQITAYANSSVMLANFLRALSAAAEETAGRAATARRIWPTVVRRVLNLNDLEHTPFEDQHYGEMALAALIPNAADEVAYLYREVQDEPITWWDPHALRPEIEAWLEVATGNPFCVDQLVIFLGAISPIDQARTGLPWVATLVLADPVRVAGRSWALSDWLIEMRPAAADVGLGGEWQQVVDALVVAGDHRLAPYSE